MPENKTNKKLLFIIFLLLFAIISYAVISRITKKEPLPEAPLIIKEKSFDERLIAFTASYKITFLALRQKEYNNAEKSSLKSFRLWEEVVNSYKDKRPKAFNKTAQWNKKLNSIGDLLGQAEQLIKINNYSEAYTKYDTVRRELRKIRQENNIKNAGDEMINFDDQLVEIIKTDKKAGVLPHLDALKLSFTMLKEYQFDENYVKLLEEMEKTIGELDKLLDGPDYQRALKRLPELFYKLYLQYG